jgi:sugar-specific transcriptional regulator TrmB
MDTISAALRRLELKDGEQAIYLSLLRQGRATARMLADRTGLTRPSVYDQIKSLVALNLVVELEVDGKAYFAAGDIKHLDALLLDRIDRLEQSREFLAEALMTLDTELDTVVPKIRFFEGSEGVKQLLKDIMWHDHETLKIIWPTHAMHLVYDAAFLRWFDERRQKRSLTAEILVPKETTKKAASAALPFAGPKDTVRSLVQKPMPSMASIIYGSKVAFISSSAEAYGFMVESREFAELHKLQFETLWQVST